MDEIKNTNTEEVKEKDQAQEEVQEKDQAQDEPKEKRPDEKGPKEKTFTQEEVNRIVQARIEREREKAEKEKSEAQKLAQMSATEKAEYRIQQLTEKLSELEQRNARSEMVQTARDMLKTEGIDVSDRLVGMIVTSDAETTKANVKDFSEIYRRDLDRAIKDALKGKTPRTGGIKTLTKDEIMKIKDPLERKRTIAKHLDLFERKE